MARKVGSNGAETAARVRAAALDLFARSGYASVSMRAIASEIGLQAGALYNHFPTKQDLLADLLVDHMQTLIGAWEAAADDTLAPADALEGFVRFHIRYHLDRSREVFISYMELRSLEPANFRRIEALRRCYESFLREILWKGTRQGAFTIDDVPVTTMAIIAMLTGMTTWYRADGRLPLSAIEDIYWTLVARSVGLDPGLAGDGELEETRICSTAP